MRARGAVSLVVLVLSWLALDDITTATPTSSAGYPLVSAGIWFTALGVSLVVKRHVFGGVSTLVAVGSAWWRTGRCRSTISRLPPSRDLGYVPLARFAGLTSGSSPPKFKPEAGRGAVHARAGQYRRGRRGVADGGRPAEFRFSTTLYGRVTTAVSGSPEPRFHAGTGPGA